MTDGSFQIAVGIADLNANGDSVSSIPSDIAKLEVWSHTRFGDKGANENWEQLDLKKCEKSEIGAASTIGTHFFEFEGIQTSQFVEQNYDNLLCIDQTGLKNWGQDNTDWKRTLNFFLIDCTDTVAC